jgi:hypothetical protein
MQGASALNSAAVWSLSLSIQNILALWRNLREMYSIRCSLLITYRQVNIFLFPIMLAWKPRLLEDGRLFDTSITPRWVKWKFARNIWKTYVPEHQEQEKTVRPHISFVSYEIFGRKGEWFPNTVCSLCQHKIFVRTSKRWMLIGNLFNSLLTYLNMFQQVIIQISGIMYKTVSV